MDLRKRLAALDGLSRKKGESPEKALESLAGPKDYNYSLLEKLKLLPIDTPAGTVWKRKYIDELAFPEGKLPDFHEVMSGAHLANPSLEEIFFLDTETTGLAGGTGTLAFLVGCSWFRDGLFHTHQLFLPGPGMESAILQEIRNLSQGFKVVMTFNGGSFDLPLLRTRALMNRLPNPLMDLVSWDLLMAGRRLWGRMLENCRQQTLEKHVCGIRRSSVDIDGALIPQTWFDFVATGVTDELEKVLYHNHRDMIGMGVIFGKVFSQISKIDKGNEHTVVNSRDECWAIGRICEKRRNQKEAQRWLLEAVSKKDEALITAEKIPLLYLDAIRVLKRSGDWESVCGLIDQALEAGIDKPWLYKEAAMLFEHRLVDLSRALVYALQAEDPHRVARLQRKLT